ncbi:MAG TPA: WGR domain-containing protein [Pirellulales bacterium]|jgi:hypothetical protein
MLNLMTVIFEAHHAERNHHRRYQIAVGRDLFDAWTISIEYGRAGRNARERQYVSGDAIQLRRIIRERLQRRLSAPRRIGCNYCISELNAAPGFDTEAWLPTDIIAKFSAA